MKHWLKYAVTMLSLAVGYAHAGSISLGQAANYNMFVKGDFSATTADTEGSAAIGGNLIINGGYDFGYVTSNGHAATVTVAGNVQKSGSGWLNVYNGQQTTGKLVYGGTLSNSGGGIGGATQQQTSSVNFNTAFSQLEQLSANLAAMTTPVSTNRDNLNKVLTFTPAVANPNNVYVFNVTQDDLNSYHTIKVNNSSISSDALIVFNMANPTGAAAKSWTANSKCAAGNKSCFQLTQTTYQVGNNSTNSGHTAMDSHILFNFNGINDLRIDSSVYGSILAPTAAISAKGGVIWGQVMAKSWSGNQQVNWNALSIPSTTPAVSAPPVWALLALPLMLMLRRRPQAHTLAFA